MALRGSALICAILDRCYDGYVACGAAHGGTGWNRDRWCYWTLRDAGRNLSRLGEILSGRRWRRASTYASGEDQAACRCIFTIAIRLIYRCGMAAADCRSREPTTASEFRSGTVECRGAYRMRRMPQSQKLVGRCIGNERAATLALLALACENVLAVLNVLKRSRGLSGAGTYGPDTV